MAYEYERDEWRSALRALTDADRDSIRDDQRTRLGVIGDRDDARDELPIDGGDCDE